MSATNDTSIEQRADLAQNEAAQFNFFLPEFRADPYPLYHQLRAAAPMYRSEALGCWVASSYEDVLTVLRGKHFGRSDSYAVESVAPLPFANALDRVLNNWLLFKDPPTHTRLRGLVSKAFTPRVIEGMRTDIQQITDGLIDAKRETGAMDIINDLAYTLPVLVITDMLGVPAEDRELFKYWSNDLVLALDPTPMNEQQFARAEAAAAAFTDYFHALVRERRRQPQDDLLSKLIAAEEAGDRLSEDELLGTCVLLLVAGHETTMNLIGNGTLALLRNPDQLEKLKADPSLIAGAVEEMLRYDSPVQMTGRGVMQSIELGGVPLQPGEEIIVLLGAANRDPHAFAEPDRLDITRRDVRHVSFAHGIHYCLGAPLARVEAQTAINMILQCLPDLALATDEPEWREHITLRGLKALPVTFRL